MQNRNSIEMQCYCHILQFIYHDSPGGSMRRGYSTFRPDNKEDRQSCLFLLNLDSNFADFTTRLFTFR